jgi:hypothetical protein
MAVYSEKANAGGATVETRFSGLVVSAVPQGGGVDLGPSACLGPAHSFPTLVLPDCNAFRWLSARAGVNAYLLGLQL